MSINFNLRKWQASDCSSLVLHANNWKIASRLSDHFPFPYTEENGRGFIEMANSPGGAIIFAIVVNEQAVGGIGLHPQRDIHRKNAEIGYWLGETFWGKGIATEAVKRMIPIAFRELDITRVFGRTFGSNPGSQRVLQKAGFVLEAEFKQTLFKYDTFEDELIFGLTKARYFGEK